MQSSLGCGPGVAKDVKAQVAAMDDDARARGGHRAGTDPDPNLVFTALGGGGSRSRSFFKKKKTTTKNNKFCSVLSRQHYLEQKLISELIFRWF